MDKLNKHLNEEKCNEQYSFMPCIVTHFICKLQLGFELKLELG